MRDALVAWLLRLYPQAWRRRYGAEFAALLAERPLTLPVIVDVLRGALDARRPDRIGQGERAMPRGVLGYTEAVFWRQWVILYTLVGLLAGLTHHLVLILLTSLVPVETTTSHFLYWWPLICGALYLVLLIAAAVVQWRLLRRLLPRLGRGWIVATVGGTLAALAMMTTDRNYGLLPDTLSMSRFALGRLGTTYVLVAGQLLPAVLYPTYFFAIAATLQAFILQRVVAKAFWWIAVSIAAALTALAAVRAVTALTGMGRYYVWQVDLVALGLDVLLTVVAYATFGAVSGAGLIRLVRRRLPAGDVRVGPAEGAVPA